MDQKISPFLTLKVTHFRNYLLGAFLSEIGNQMQIVAVAWQVYEITRNPASLGLIGLAIAGFLIGGVGVTAVYFLNAASFLFFIGALLTLNVSLQKHDAEEVEFSFSSILDGVKFVAKTPILVATMILDFSATFFGTATILMPLFAQDVLHVGPQGLGLLYSAPAIGGVLAGGLIAALHKKIEHQGRAIIYAVLLYGLATIGFGLSKIFLLSIFFLILLGFGDMVSTIIRNTIRQMITPDQLRGRMASVMRIFFQGGPQLGDMEAGFLAKAVGGPASVVVGGVGVLIVLSLLAFKGKTLREYHGKDLAV